MDRVGSLTVLQESFSPRGRRKALSPLEGGLIGQPWLSLAQGVSPPMLQKMP